MNLSPTTKTLLRHSADHTHTHTHTQNEKKNSINMNL